MCLTRVSAGGMLSTERGASRGTAVRHTMSKKNKVIECKKKHVFSMITVKAIVLRLAEANAFRAGKPASIGQTVDFVAKFSTSNAVLQCTLQDRLQAHHIVPGNELSLTVVGLREELGALLVDVDENAPVCVSSQAGHGEQSQRPLKKRHFFETLT